MNVGLHIGLVNNMPDAALESTERQFRTLLSEGAGGLPVRLSLFAITEVPRSEQARNRMSCAYLSLGALWNTRLDGLIVTGAEPRAPKLTDEPYWAGLAKVIDWAEEHTESCIFSCLAAHAAALQKDGLERRQLSGKLCGVYECAKVSDHPLVSGLPARWCVPHSRWNDLPEQDLVDHGYRVLTRSNEAGVDTFVKQAKSLSVLFQGHPEYDAGSLLLEHRRDIRRFHRGESAWCPAAPPGSSNIWHSGAVRFYRNWLKYLSEEKIGTLYHPLGAGAAAGRALEEGRDGPL